jgi:prophage DNA circulation protein
MRDWTKLLPASFNGVPFHVDSEELSAGRRQAVHMVAGEMPPVIEEIGPGARTFSVTAYVTGDLADFKSHALVAALMMPGPGMLVLPIDGPMMAHVVEDGIRRARSKDRNGYIAMDLGFILAGETGGAVLGFADVAFAFRANVGGAALALSVAF